MYMYLTMLSIILSILLQNMIGASSKKELNSCDALLPLSNTPNAWQTAKPITKISESIYPFDKNKIRPSIKKVRHYVNVCYKV